MLSGAAAGATVVGEAADTVEDEAIAAAGEATAAGGVMVAITVTATITVTAATVATIVDGTAAGVIAGENKSPCNHSPSSRVIRLPYSVYCKVSTNPYYIV